MQNISPTIRGKKAMPLTHANNRRLQIETKMCFGPNANFFFSEFHFDKLNHMEVMGRMGKWMCISMCWHCMENKYISKMGILN